MIVIVAFPVDGTEGGLFRTATSLLALTVAALGMRVMAPYQLGVLKSFVGQIGRWAVIVIISASSAALTLILFSDTKESAAGWPVAWAIQVLLLIAGSRVIVTPIVRAGLMTKRIAVVGDNEVGRAIVKAIDAEAGSGFSLVGVFDDDWPGRQNAIGKVGDLATLSRFERVDSVLVASALPVDFQRALAQLRSVVAEIAVVETSGVTPTIRSVQKFCLGNINLTVVMPRALSDWEVVQKAVFDRAVALALLITALPFLLLIAVAIKIDSPGPVFFRQPRLGYNNVVFSVLKFRTMYHGMADLMADKQTSQGDVRVTRVGRVLRALSLDELSQLFNVFAGNMSMVGPRPHALNTSAGGFKLADAVAEYAERHRVKPGITGWAQVNGSRGELKTVDQLNRRVSYDLEYIQNWSLWLDVKIIILTIRREIFSAHAF